MNRVELKLGDITVTVESQHGEGLEKLLSLAQTALRTAVAEQKKLLAAQARAGSLARLHHIQPPWPAGQWPPTTQYQMADQGPVGPVAQERHDKSTWTPGGLGDM